MEGDTHPVIDVSPILASDYGSDRSRAVQRIGHALRTRGYFYAQNVSVLSEEYIKSVYDYSRRIHNLPVEVKSQYSQRDGHGAYSGLDIGQAELAYDPTTVSSVRAWDYSRTRFTLKKSDDPNQNRYPGSDLVEPDYVSFMDDLYERQNKLGRALMVAFAECLELPSRTFLDMFTGLQDKDLKQGGDDVEEKKNGDFGTIRLLSYPEMTSKEADKANMGISAHTDFEAFTLMHQDAPGLQFIPMSGEGWIDAPVRPGEFVVIVGDVLERFTNGVLKATPHRVVLTPHHRQSIIRFNAVTPDTIIAPLPEFVDDDNDNPSRYSPVTMRTHMETTMRNLEKGLGAWDHDKQISLTATYDYKSP
uniref:Fe2OG dioxygenase domain-containing protein n=1 Tax=Pseudictyota dubia TaxID=2749911 RepID=A0A7R9VJY9_9STRA